MAAASSAALTLPPLGSINMDDLLRNMYPSPSPASSSAADHEITLEDFLAKDAASSVLAPADPAVMIEDDGDAAGGRRRKRALTDPVDKVALQRQKRMIKNRESAARSRERKQAYTMELEALASKLEDENTELVKYQEDQDRTRLKQVLIELNYYNDTTILNSVHHFTSYFIYIPVSDNKFEAYGKSYPNH